MNLKLESHKKAIEELEKKLTELKHNVERLQEAYTDSSKNAAGDKYETEREVLQDELDRADFAYNNTKKQITLLKSINPLNHFSIIETGAFVKTSMAIIYISISYGKLKVGNEKIMLIGPTAPIAQAMLGKKAGDEFVLNGKIQTIKSVE